MFACAKHPANHLAVQRILARAAFFSHEPVMQQSMLVAAEALSRLPSSASEIDRQGRLRRSSRRKSLSCYYLRPRSITGVGEGCARIACEAGAELTSIVSPNTAAEEPLCIPSHNRTADEGGLSREERLCELRGLGRMMSFDEIAHIGDRVRSVLEQTFGKEHLLFSSMGPHRRGKPFHSSVELLVSHTAVVRPKQGELLGFAERAVRALELANLVDRKPVKWVLSGHITSKRFAPSALLLGSGGSVADLSGAFVRAHCRFNACVSASDGRLPQISYEMDRSSGRLRALRRPLLLQFTTCDRFVPQQFLLTGSDAFVRAVVHRPPRLKSETFPLAIPSRQQVSNLHYSIGENKHTAPASVSSWNSMQLSLQGAYSCGTYLSLPSEAALFARLNLPYIHPLNRYQMEEVPLELYYSRGHAR